MRFQVIAAVVLAHGAFAALDRRQDTIPACLTSCISDANTDTCDPADTACLCNNQTFVNSITSCVQSTCDADSVQAAAQSASALCQAAGATLAIPTSTEGGASSASSAFSSLASSASSAASAASSVASSAASGASSAASSAASGSGTATTTQTSTSASATSDNNSASPKSVSLLAGFAALFAALVL